MFRGVDNRDSNPGSLKQIAHMQNTDSLTAGKSTIEKTEGAINYWKSRETDNSGPQTQNEDKKTKKIQNFIWT